MNIKNPTLFGDKTDPLLAGVISIFFLLSVLVFEESFKENDVWYFAWIMAFFVNGPHFLISYLLFYRLAGDRVFKENGFLVPGVLIPVVLIGVWLGAGFFNCVFLMETLLYSMFFLVGWHYVKQGFGVLMVHSSMRKIYFSDNEKVFIRVCIYLLWMASFLNMFSDKAHENQFWGMTYSIPAVIPALIESIKVMALFGLLALIVFFIVRKMKNIHDSPTGLIGFFINYIWLLPAFKNPIFALMVPMFHSLQYLLFSGSVVFNIEKKINSDSLIRNSIFKWWAPAFILAALGFHFAPLLLDSYLGAPADFGAAKFYLIGFILFINIHHYFIDSVLWKRESGLVREYLKPL